MFTTSQDNKQDVETCNYGLVIWNSASLATMDLGETPLVILPRVFQRGISEKGGGIFHLNRNSEQRNMSHSLTE